MPTYCNCPNCSSDDIEAYSLRYRVGYPHFSRSKCKLCGLVYANPMATREELSLFYQCYYDKGNFGNAGYKEKIQKQYLDIKDATWEQFSDKNKFTLAYYRLHKCKSGKFLDIGCGLGNALMLAHKCNYDIYGTEYDGDAVGFVKQMLPSARIFHGDVIDAKYPEVFFDYVLLYHVIEHVINPKELLAEVYRILKPNGILLIGTPNIDNIGYLLHRIMSFLTFKIPAIVDGIEHTVIFSKKTLAQMVQSHKFKIVEHKGEGHTESWLRIIRSNDSILKKGKRITEKLFCVNQKLICIRN